MSSRQTAQRQRSADGFSNIDDHVHGAGQAVKRPPTALAYDNGFLPDDITWCVYRKPQNPAMVVIKSAQDGVRTYGTGSLSRPRIWRIFV